MFEKMVKICESFIADQNFEDNLRAGLDAGLNNSFGDDNFPILFSLGIG